MLDNEPESYQYSPIEQVFVGVHPVYSPPSTVCNYLADPDNGIHTCEDCGDKFLFESSLTYHKGRTTVSIQYNCEECCHKLSFYNRCKFLSHLRQHNFDLSKKDFSNVDFSLLILPPSKLVSSLLSRDECQGIGKSLENMYHWTTNTTKCRSDDEQNSNCSSSTSGFVSEAQSIRSVEMSPLLNEKRKNTGLTCPECQSFLFIPLEEHYWPSSKPQNSYYQCKYCNLTLPTKCCLAAHIRLHTLEKPYVCPECGDTFDEHPQLVNHVSKICCHEHRVLQYNCKLCILLFDTTSALHKHISLRHTGGDIYSCDHCSGEYSSKLILKRHLEESHNIKMSVRLVIDPCKYCQFCKSIISKRKYITHVQKHCNSSLCYGYHCRKCILSYLTLEDFQQHRRMCCHSTKYLTESMETLLQQDEPISHPTVIESSADNNTLSPVARRKIGTMFQFGKIVDSKFQCNLCKEIIATTHIQNHFITVHKSHRNVAVERSVVIQEQSAVNKLSISSNRKDASTDTNVEPYHCTSNSQPASGRKKRPAEALKHDILDSDNHSLTKTGRPKKSRGRPSSNKAKEITESVRSHTPVRNGKLKKNSKRIENHVGTRQSKECTKANLIQDSNSLICLKCQFSAENNDIFKEHIKQHRTSSDFQCMECGLCFVTKPSFNIHLIMTHKIKNVDAYIENNDCCNLQEVVKEISDPPKIVSKEEIPTTLQENQCSICHKVCDGALNLSNHFRTHGMAYLLMKKREGQKVDKPEKTDSKV